MPRAEYRAALEQKPDLGEGHLNLGVVCMLTGRLDEAESEVALAEKAGVKVPQALKDDIQKRRARSRRTASRGILRGVHACVLAGDRPPAPQATA